MRSIEIIYRTINSVILTGAWRAVAWYENQKVKRENESSFRALSHEAQALVKEEALRELVVWLRLKLRRAPYWKRGHLELSKISLTLDDIGSAYASAQAVNTLSPGSEEGESILATCHLRRGSFDEAAARFEALARKNPKRISYKEDLAAALLGKGDKEGASRVLSGIPEANRSQASKTALSYAVRKEP